MDFEIPDITSSPHTNRIGFIAVPDFVKIYENVCLCCLRRDVPLINLSSCTHKSFFDCYKIILPNASVCYICHHTLKKFETFKFQAIMSYKILMEQQPLPSISYDLQKSKIDTTIIPFSNMDAERNSSLKNEGFNENVSEGSVNVDSGIVQKQCIKSVFPTEVKIERDTLHSGPTHYAYKSEDGTDFNTTEDTTAGMSNETLFDNRQFKVEIEQECYKLTTKKTTIKTNVKNKSGAKKNNRKTRKTQKKVRYSTHQWNDLLKGKINTLILSKDILQKEREERRLSEAYKSILYKCDMCLCGWNIENAYKKHLKRHDKTTGQFICEVCTQVFQQRRLCLKHQEEHYKRYECMVCNKQYRYFPSCVQHYNTEHASIDTTIQGFDFNCPKNNCDFTTSKKGEYQRHLNSHKPKPVCSICTKQFSDNCSLSIHMRSIHDKSDRSYKCEFCTNEYKTRSGWKLHMTSHTIDVQRCPRCDKEFCNKDALQKHVLKAHKKKEKKCLICDDCGKTFNWKNCLRMHIESTHLNLQHKCQECPRVFRVEDRLKLHYKRIHQNVLILCHLCGKEYKDKKTLIEHMRSHTGERPLHCEECGVTFAHSSSLYMHRRGVHKRATIRANKH